MAGKLRIYRQRRRSVTAISKITRAMELVAASRIRKAQDRARAAAPYARELTRAVSALATYSRIDHPLATQRAERHKAAVVVLTSDRGLAGAYSANVLREAERLTELLRADGLEVRRYLCGRKAVAFYRFRGRDIAAEWTGFSEAPVYANAREVGDKVVGAFLADPESAEESVDEIHIVYTRFVSMMVQQPEVIRLLPLEIVEGEEPPAASEMLPLYEFEPSAGEVLDVLLPRYVNTRVYACMLQAAASEQAARQRAMNSATDNAKDMLERLQRDINQERQAEITQEISEIVGGANALAESASATG